ncbi:hypothetical protein ACFE04_014892 [Oxalis oulophora]
MWWCDGCSGGYVVVVRWVGVASGVGPRWCMCVGGAGLVFWWWWRSRGNERRKRIGSVSCERGRVRENALVPYFVGDNGQKALFLYGQDDTIVPFNLLRKRKPRPKVDLDDETNKVWKLLLADINSEGIECEIN